MKFIPTPAFERINSVLAGVDALGCKTTLRVEAFSCKKSKEEKKTKQLIMINSAGNSTNSGGGGVGGNSSGEKHSNNNNSGPGSPGMGFPDQSFTGSEEGGDEDYTSDDRFLYLVSALNTIYGGDYDFSVLGPQHFHLVDAFGTMKDVDQILAAVPSEIVGQNAHNEFWGTLNEQIVVNGGGANHTQGMPPLSNSGNNNNPQQQQQQQGHSPGNQQQGGAPSLASECDFFKFVSPDCDPAAQSKKWSHHYFIYAKRTRLMVSLLCYGEDNNGGGGDEGGMTGGGQGNNGWSAMGPSGSPTWYGPSGDGGTDSPCYYYEADNGNNSGGFGGSFPSQPGQGGRGGGAMGSVGNLMAYDTNDAE